MNKRIRSAAAIAALALAAAARGEPVRVVTTIFPLADWAREVGGDRVEVVQLLPPGVEAHSFAPRPSDVARVQRADLFIYLGPDLEPWAERLVRAAARAGRIDLEAGRGIERRAAAAGLDDEHKDHDGKHDDDHDHDHEGKDPHIWLDPVLAQDLVRAIADALARADPAGADGYRQRADAYIARLRELDERIAAGLRDVRYRTILYGGHFAFGYFARRYGLEHRSPYRGFAPNATPTPRALAGMVREIRDSGQTVIFHEELVDPSVARVIAEQTGARMVLLHGAHNLSREESERGGVTYLSIMDTNLQRLREGLGAP